MAAFFNGKIVIVTGAGAGIGRATAVAFAREGAKVIVNDVNSTATEETVRLIRAAGGEALFKLADTSQSSQMAALVDYTLDQWGRLDFAFNNAGIEGSMGSTIECTEENWDRTININLKGVWLGMKYQIPAMLKTGGGAIVNMASVAGLVGFPNLPAYCASKGGVVQLTKGAALEFAESGIRVNAVCPGVIKTDMVDRITGKDPESEASFAALQAMNRMGKPEEVAEAVLWLCSDAASFITGHAMAVDGGFVAR